MYIYITYHIWSISFFVCLLTNIRAITSSIDMHLSGGRGACRGKALLLPNRHMVVWEPHVQYLVHGKIMYSVSCSRIEEVQRSRKVQDHSYYTSQLRSIMDLGAWKGAHSGNSSQWTSNCCTCKFSMTKHTLHESVTWCIMRLQYF